MAPSGDQAGWREPGTLDTFFAPVPSAPTTHTSLSTFDVEEKASCFPSGDQARSPTPGASGGVMRTGSPPVAGTT